VIKHTLIHSMALLVSCAIPAGAFCVALQTTPFFGGAAFTTALVSLGGLIGLPGLIGGLLGLLVLQVVAYLVTFILLQIWLAWVPV
jgi:hypothetical protein